MKKPKCDLCKKEIEEGDKVSFGWELFDNSAESYADHGKGKLHRDPCYPTVRKRLDNLLEL